VFQKYYIESIRKGVIPSGIVKYFDNTLRLSDQFYIPTNQDLTCMGLQSFVKIHKY
jgi:hypothetical protein